jgi:hypothetical protein
MKNFNINLVNELSNAVFVRFGFNDDFKVLLDQEGKTFEFVSDAVPFVREHHSDQHVELADFRTALSGDSNWDNL